MYDFRIARFNLILFMNSESISDESDTQLNWSIFGKKNFLSMFLSIFVCSTVFDLEIQHWSFFILHEIYCAIQFHLFEIKTKQASKFLAITCKLVTSFINFPKADFFLRIFFSINEENIYKEISEKRAFNIFNDMQTLQLTF